MRTAAVWTLALLLAGASATQACATTVSPVDDSGTIVSQPVVQMRWRMPAPGRTSDNTVETQIRVALRLNLARWINQPVQVYMLLARGTGSTVQARWRTQGRLVPGVLSSGGRTLIYQGVVSSGVLEETIDLSLETDGRMLVYPLALQFNFEVETQ